MSLLNKLEERIGHLAIPNLTLALVVCQIIVYAAWYTQKEPADQQAVIDRLTLVAEKVLEGQVWRLVSFVAIFPPTNPLFALFAWYLFFMMGTALEHHWGTFRYNVFLLVGWLLTVAVAFLYPDKAASAAFWQGSVFLAFAQLYPHFVLHLFFILAVEIRWLALLAWIAYAIVFLNGDGPERLVILAAVGNFLLFFSKDILERVSRARRRTASQAAMVAPPETEYYHRCRVCGITDKSHPQMDFRYCSKCAGDCCYCAEHLRTHEHVVSVDGSPAP